MAIYHLSVKTISRSAGRSATAAAAYRAGVEITDERTGEIHDYTRKGGVESAELVLPAGAPEWAADRAALWNAAEQAEKRKNSTVAREFEIALPAELSPAERARLARDLAREIVERHGCAADVCIHAPGKDGDDRNHHAHILLTTRRLGPEGFGEKTRELDDQKTGPQIVTQWRERFAQLQNERLREAGHSVQVDHRSHAERGLDAEPTRHLGPAATGYERRTGEPSRKRLDFEAEIADRLTRAREAGELERQGRQIDRGILDLSGDLEAAKRERDRQLAERAAAPKTAEQSRQEAEQLARQAIGQGVRLYAVGEGATARGQIVGETAHHYVQRVSPTVAAIHEKARFGHLPPGQRPKIGQHLAIGYTDGKAKATPIQPPGRGRGLTR
ncbi:MAG: MobQ family relaxase [Anaerolineae bacterium]|nr:MobQ family relaxase [Anaerolineae bacterium]